MYSINTLFTYTL